MKTAFVELLILTVLLASILMPPAIVPLSLMLPLMVLLVRLTPPGLIVPVVMTLPLLVALVKWRCASAPALVQPVVVTPVLAALQAAARAGCASSIAPAS